MTQTLIYLLRIQYLSLLFLGEGFFLSFSQVLKVADVISKKLYQFFVQVQSEYGLLKRLENHVDILLLTNHLCFIAFLS